MILAYNRVTISQKVQLAWAIDITVINYRNKNKLRSGCR